MSRCAIRSWNFQNGRRCHGNWKKGGKMKVLRIGSNFTGRLPNMCRIGFWSPRLENGRRCHGNGKKAGKFKVLRIEWNFTGRSFRMWISHIQTWILIWEFVWETSCVCIQTQLILVIILLLFPPKFCPPVFSETTGPILTKLHRKMDPHAKKCNQVLEFSKWHRLPWKRKKGGKIESAQNWMKIYRKVV